MIKLGEVHCHWCGDAFEPEGIPSLDGPDFCSDDCQEDSETEEACQRDCEEIYNEARYGSAAVHE